MNPDDVQLSSLVGTFQLTGCETSLGRHDRWGDGSVYEDAQAISFVLNGWTYTAVEDPSDGYRSSLGKIHINEFEVKNTFPSVTVIGVKNPHPEMNTVVFTDAFTGNLVLEVGTRLTDSYYPCFVASFYPHSMACNAPGAIAERNREAFASILPDEEAW